MLELRTLVSRLSGGFPYSGVNPTCWAGTYTLQHVDKSNRSYRTGCKSLLLLQHKVPRYILLGGNSRSSIVQHGYDIRILEMFTVG